MLCLVAPTMGLAATYACTAPDGTKTYSDQPCKRAMQSPYECDSDDGKVRTFKDQNCKANTVVERSPGSNSNAEADKLYSNITKVAQDGYLKIAGIFVVIMLFAAALILMKALFRTQSKERQT